MIKIHEKFLPLLEPLRTFRNYTFYGGRDSTKSWSVAYILLIIAMREAGHLILCAKGTQISIADSAKALLEKLIEREGWGDCFEIKKTEIICLVTGSRFIFKGLKNARSIKSTEGITICWVEEANVDTTENTYEILLPTIRTENSIVVLTFNPEDETDYVYQRYVKNPRDIDYLSHVTYKDNRFLSEVSKVEIEHTRNSNYHKYLYIYGGECKKETEGALWNRDIIPVCSKEEKEHYFKTEFSEFERIVVAIDPSITSKNTSDACGIVAVGKLLNQEKFVVLDDKTAILTPSQWADTALSLYYRYKADRIVAEINQGGDMVKTIIHQKDRVPYRGVHASRGKITRAEPIAALYEELRVTHIEHFAGLEYEMVTYTGAKSEKSPNSLDALVWGLTDLSGRKSRKGYANVSPAGTMF